MLNLRRSPIRRRNARRSAILFLSLLLLSIGSQAQSGRRPPKQPKSPDPLPSKQEEPPITQPTEQKSIPKIPVKVVWDLYAIASSSTYSRSVQEACLDELSKSGS